MDSLALLVKGLKGHPGEIKSGLTSKKKPKKQNLDDYCLWPIISFGNPNLTLKGMLSLTHAVDSLYEGRYTNDIAWFLLTYHYI